jgi:hypothetical protein
LNYYIDRVKYNVSKERPISKKSLLYFIPEIFNEKLELDNKLEIEKKNRKQLDEFFIELMLTKFKLNKLVKKHCEETIMAVQKYAGKNSNYF